MFHELPKRISGVMPALAVTNEGRTECGVGAIICHGEALYFNTYAASGAYGDDNRLYRLEKNGVLTAFPGSVGGTHANRWYHAPSEQWIIGLYFIARDGSVRALNPRTFSGRLTGLGRHITDPEHFVYISTMEDGLYEVNVYTLAFRRLRRDRYDDLRCENARLAAAEDKLWGDHGKGGYGAQGVYVISNNGHGGVLAEWNGQGDPQKRAAWRIIDRAKYTEITAPGDVLGPDDPNAPIWALGWDEKSVLLNTRTPDGLWTRYRLPKASFTQDADHGWYTEWPRIRRAQGRNLMCMHGMFYDFPDTFTPRQTGGLRPIARHLKMIADWADWQGEIAFACDDASMFGNPLLGRQQSNLWFAGRAQLAAQSAPEGFGCIWLRENVAVGQPSEPFFVGGFDHVLLHIAQEEMDSVRFLVEQDRDGSGLWTTCGELTVSACGEDNMLTGYAFLDLKPLLAGDWIRLHPCADATCVTASLYLSNDARTECEPELVAGLHRAGSTHPFEQGLLRPLPGPELRLEYENEQGHFVLDETFTPDGGSIDPCAALHTQVHALEGSVLLIDARGRRWRLPKLSQDYDGATERDLREVVTERSLLNVCGSIFEVPRVSAGGYQRMKPVTAHGLRIHDFCSWRGMLVLSGVDCGGEGAHILRGEGAALWLGNVDDLWKFGKPVGTATLCHDQPLLPGEASDPLLMTGYHHKQVTLLADADVEVAIEVDVAANDVWGEYRRVTLQAGEPLSHRFPEGYCAHWVRVRPLQAARLTAVFRYT